MSSEKELKKVLTPAKLWGIIVGAVISGMYAGWNYAFEKTNFVGVLIATLIVTVFYVAFVLSYSELATSIPSSAGPSAYAEKAFGRFAGFIAGFSILVEYLFATPGIAIAIGAYVHMLVPAIPTTIGALAAYLLFIYINCKGMESAAKIELAVTVLAIAGVVVFVIAGLPSMHMSNLFESGKNINGFAGIFAAIPYAVWFYLAVEAGAMGAEECKNPKKDIPKSFITGILSLVAMAIGILLITAGNASTDVILSTDSPLPTVLALTYGEGSFIVVIVSILGLFGLIASLHGIIIGYSRQAYAMSRNRFLPAFLSELDKNGTPVRSIIATSAIGIVCVLIGSVNVLVVISCIGSTVMAILCLASLFALRKKEPKLERPYKVSYPVIPIIASLSCIVVVVAMIVSNSSLLIAAVIAYGIAILYYFTNEKIVVRNEDVEPII